MPLNKFANQTELQHRQLASIIIKDNDTQTHTTMSSLNQQPPVESDADVAILPNPEQHTIANQLANIATPAEPALDLTPVTAGRSPVLGVGISTINLESATELVFEAINRQQKGFVCVTGVHGVIESQDSAEFRGILNGSFLTTPDGMPMVWLSKLNGHSHVDRVYGPDLMLEVCRQGVSRGCRHFLYGGGDGVAEKLAEGLRKKCPGINIVGTYTPPFRPLTQEEEHGLADQVKDAQPDCLWVGLSTPKQERFMVEYLPKLDTTLMFGVGAAFDFHAGLVRQAPRWIQRSGMEWLFRLVMEPRRLWKRYLVNNTRFVTLLARQLLMGKPKK